MELDDGPATPAALRCVRRPKKVYWTRGNGQRARQLVLRRMVFRFSRRKARGALTECSIGVATVCAALSDAGLIALPECVSDLITRFGGEPHTQDVELSHKTMGPLAYNEERALERKLATVAASASQPATKASISFNVKLKKGNSVPRPARSQVAGRSTEGRGEGKPTKTRGEEPRRPRVWPAGHVPYLAAETLLLSMLSDSALETLVQARARRNGRPTATDDEEAESQSAAEGSQSAAPDLGSDCSSSDEDEDDQAAPARACAGSPATLSVDARVLRRQWLGLVGTVGDPHTGLRNLETLDRVAQGPRWDAADAWAGTFSRREWMSAMEVA